VRQPFEVAVFQSVIDCEIAPSLAGNLASGIVPAFRFAAF
jgi:hypothetical protein